MHIMQLVQFKCDHAMHMHEKIYITCRSLVERGNASESDILLNSVYIYLLVLLIEALHTVHMYT